jgi:formylglycine-generating enzyme required for sulfatase activity/dienelactone hydrolase/predicted Ser/Thr protein kinase
MPLSVGERLGPYEILGLVGKGGMGEVYRARDTRLHRTIAIKLVRPELARRADFRERFQREARAISALNHPHICSLYDIGEQDGLAYLVMEYVEGESLAEALKRGPQPVELALRYGSEIADALAAAHARGIVHRDLKPGNIMITETGLKVLDFGLAKRSDPAAAADGATVTLEAGTSAGQLLGTVAYMSPEQAEGLPLDTRSDIFALGVVLYEMLCGRRPFRGETTLATLASILREDPQAPRQLLPAISVELERIILRCLAKKPDQRYGSAAEVARDLEQLRKPVATGITLRRPLVAALALVLLAVLGALGTRWYMRSSRARWAETQALPQVAQLIERSQFMAALKLLHQAEQYVPSSPELMRLREDLRLLPVTIETTPAAEIYATDYTDPKAADVSQWEHLGRSPLKTDRLPHRGYYRIRAVKDGFEPVESAVYNAGGARAAVQMMLHTKAETPPGMVWIPMAPPAPLAVLFVQLPAAQIPAMWMDKYEVTNRQFKEFVDAGGYQKREYWKRPFVKEGKELSWEAALAGFRDATGRPGPSTWEGGSYPDGKADFPVGGVSWYEADAYAEFAGKSLPTVYHWDIAAGFGINSQITSLSNFGGQGPARVGSNLGMAPYGNYDMAGNVREWTANRSGEKRYILGGGWNESSYMFQQGDLRSPWDRGATFGFRCVRYVSPVPEALNGQVIFTPTDRSRDQPVDDRTFQVFKGLLSYDKIDLKATVDSVTDAPHWRRENLSFQAAYGNERVILHLYLPKDAAPPYQAVFYFGGNNMGSARTPEEVSTRLMEYIVKSGRALVLPAYAGTLERGPTPLNTPPGHFRDLRIQQFKDVARSIDYLETRHDIDLSKLGYYGLSLGAQEGVIVLGAEPRFKAAVLVSVGSGPVRFAEIDIWNYAPRVKIPVLMQNGHDDSLFPVETSQKPLFKALGTPEKDKRHIIYPGGHVDFIDRLEVVKEALDWLDHYLGPVKLQP